VKRQKGQSGLMPGPLLPVGEYSTEVQQLTRTRTDLRGRGRTVTCGDGRGWTCCRQMACKRSGVRISLAPLVRSEIRIDRTGSTAAKYSNGGPVGRRTYVRIECLPAPALLARPPIPSRAAALPALPAGQIALRGYGDSCRLVTAQHVRAVVSPLTVAVFAGGRRAAIPGISRSTTGTDTDRPGVCVRGSRPCARRAAPDGAQ
jgi:hypothetical protein